MTDFRPVLARLNQNLNLLQERQAKYGDNPPLELLNQIEDHREAIRLTGQAAAGAINEAEWRQALAPLLVAINHRSGEAAVHLTINITQAPAPGPGPPNTRLWRWLVPAAIVVALVAGIVGIFTDSLAVIYGPLFPTPTATVTPTLTPTPLPTVTPLAAPTAAQDQILILIASFHETAAAKTEPHVKIQRTIKQVAAEVNLDRLRVELEPTILTADQRQEAEALGNLYNASIVIWGEDTGVQVLVNFLNLKQPEFHAAEVTIDEVERVQIANPAAYTRFVLEDLPGQLSFLSLFAVGQSYYVAGQYEQARAAIQRGIDRLSDDSRPPGLAEAYFALGWLLQVPLAEEPQIVIDKYSQAIELDPDYALAYNNRGNAHYSREDYQAAIADYSKTIELDPDFAGAYNNRGNAYAGQGDYRAAIADFSRAIELEPDFAGSYNNRGLTYAGQGDYQAAIADYNKAIELNPDDALVYGNRGLAYYEQEDYQAAIADYNKAIELNPDFAWAYTNLGVTHYIQGDYPAAIADFTRAIELEPESAETYTRRGLAYNNQGNPQAALADFNKAIELNPDNALAYYRRGLTSQAQGNYRAAIADFTRAIELEPENALVYGNRGIAYAGQEDYQAAIADFNKVIELNPADALAYYNRGHAYYDQENYRAAVADFSQVIKLDPDNALAYYNRGDSYERLGEYDKAIDDINRGMALDTQGTYHSLAQEQLEIINQKIKATLQP